MAQAWHWVDRARAVPEVARVLRPGGWLGLVWNERDEQVRWVAELGRVMGVERVEDDLGRGGPQVGAPFGPVERHVTRWQRVLLGVRTCSTSSRPAAT